MIKKYLSLVFLLAFTLSCGKSTYQLSQKKATYFAVDNQDKKNKSTAIDQLLAPYSSAMNNDLNVPLAYSENLLEKGLPESALGNWVADVMLERAKTYTGLPVDGALINYGGIRSSIPNGEITVRHIFEMMPFDNEIVVVQLKGSTVQQLADRFANTGGTPIAGFSFTTANGKAKNIKFAGNPLQLDKTYWIALTDYIADGGDNCGFLKNALTSNRPQVIFRDAIINYLKELRLKGVEPVIKPILENRVTKE